ncbi:MAG: hypothetical protein AB8B55_15130 [Mariniblastus sp.]
MIQQNSNNSSVTGCYTELSGIGPNDETFYKISNSHQMEEFFISLVSSSNHWMFISSNGALTCGRRDPNGAMFPYYSSDKIVDQVSSTGPRTVIRIESGEHAGKRWQPFQDAGFSKDSNPTFSVKRNLYKNIPGNKLVFEEINETLNLSFRYCWTFSEKFGFVRRSRLLNEGNAEVEVTLLDGIQNILPYGIEQYFQMRFSNLGSAYKKNELLEDSDLGLFYLSSIPTDKAEPSEGLRATTVWQNGLDQPSVLLSEEQIQKFYAAGSVKTETDVRGRRGAYLLVTSMPLQPDVPACWDIVADVERDQTDVIDFHQYLCSKNSEEIKRELDEDIELGQQNLMAIISTVDGCQSGAEQVRTHRHQANVLFNAMRGGIPVAQYQIATKDFCEHVSHTNKAVFERNGWLADLTAKSTHVSVQELHALLKQKNDTDLFRIGHEYLPLTFSRRHGDPTRPWNAFAIEVQNEDGSPKVSYQGNWRDIFQNWEALAVSYPEFVSGMIFRFVNASTADGYNPYRLTSEGIEWEVIEPDDPWSNIGYWGDHQIIYLLKLLEVSRAFDPSQLSAWLNEPCCTYAEIPYRIRSYEQIQRDPNDTIDYDLELANEIEKRVEAIGADGKLLAGESGVHHVSFVEKLLVPALVKLTNFVPGGGIWLNTQRPEWNDANNALVGNGLSMVTVCYLRRYFDFLRSWFSELSDVEAFAVSGEVNQLISRVTAAISKAQGLPMGDSKARAEIVDELSQAGSDHRQAIYRDGFSGEMSQVSMEACQTLFEGAIFALDQTIKANRRDDGLYHSYNLLQMDDEGVSVEHLQEMLEGQVAVLSSGLLAAEEVVALLETLRASKMYREDQNSYILYPDRDLSRFVDKNVVSADEIAKSKLLTQLISAGDSSVIRKDSQGDFHFNGDLRNSRNLRDRLNQLSNDVCYSSLIEIESDSLAALFEEVFDHRRFTGRSGTFFGYEGLGSIYWHMVSKLALAAIENLVRASESNVDSKTIERLHQQYRDIRDGIAFGKTPKQYGAFPSDPYSHTPARSGVKQPGMTGQVKEDVLGRLSEIGLRVRDGIVSFDPAFFESSELHAARASFHYVDFNGTPTVLELGENSFGWTLCQTPIVYRDSNEDRLVVHMNSGEEVTSKLLSLTAEQTKHLVSRDGVIKTIEVFSSKLKK